MRKLLKDDDIIICGICGSQSLLKTWDDCTYKECITREMRRAYTKLNDIKVFNRQVEIFYKCPICGRWQRGYNLGIESNDKELAKLGRVPTMTWNENEEHEGQ